METLKFKTNINCGGCIAKVTPFLNDEEGIEKWKVDIDNPEKTLTVNVCDIGAAGVIEAVKKAGFNIQQKD